MRNDATVWIMAAALAISGPVRAQEKEKQGEKVFQRACAACHTVEPGKNKAGPSLAGIVGQKAGSVPNFKYSDAMKNSNVIWTEDSLKKFLADPKTFIPGNRMTVPGMKKEDEREAVIEYLKSAKSASSG